MAKQDALIEILTEELPPKNLRKLMNAFAENMKAALANAELSHGEVRAVSTPRRLALRIEDLADTQPKKIVERKGPSLKAAFDPEGRPTPACEGFARSCGVSVKDLQTHRTEKEGWVFCRMEMPSQSTMSLLPNMVQHALEKLPVAKPMRWGDHETLFVRPVHGCVLMYGKKIVPGTVLGQRIRNVTQGHRFMAPKLIALKNPQEYESVLEKKGKVIVDFDTRREKIRDQVMSLAKQKKGTAEISEALLDEVTGLVEWPEALLAQFDPHFLDVPSEALISAMEVHQRSFPVRDAEGKLLPYFITVSNIHSKDPKQVIAGNERVMCARLSDAAFFYHTDCKVPLEDRVEGLKRVVFQAKLGSVYDKTKRVMALAAFIAGSLNAQVDQAKRAAQLAKADLLSDMVNEFPELQGVMGSYYVLHDGESPAVAQAIREHVLPRFAGDRLPSSMLGCAVAVADRMDTLVGIFGVGQAPTGDKDPFGLRRAVIGILRILIENKKECDLVALIQHAVREFDNKITNPEIHAQVRVFFYERLRAWYLEQGVRPDVITAVLAKEPERILDFHHRVNAVAAFSELPQAKALAAANKRVSNILIKEGQLALQGEVQSQYLQAPEEKALAAYLAEKVKATQPLFAQGEYTALLKSLADLQTPVDAFFDHVMVMVEDPALRRNRLLLLSTLRQLFLQVADISLLQ